MKNNLKIVVDGDTYVGKTSLIKKFVYDVYSDKSEILYTPQIIPATIELSNINFNIEFIDLLGAKRYDHLRESFYKKADCLMIIIDLTDKFYQERLVMRIELAEKANIRRDHIIIVGNKADLKEDIILDFNQLGSSLEKYDLRFYIETSAKMNINVKQIFHIATALCASYRGIINERNFESIIERIGKEIKSFQYQKEEDLLDLPLDSLIEQDKEFLINCPYCFSKINKFQERCPFCHSELK